MNLVAQEIENSLIAAVLHAGNTGRQQAHYVKAEYFGNKNNQAIWKAIVKAPACGPLMVEQTIKEMQQERLLPHLQTILALKPTEPLLAMVKKICQLAALRDLQDANVEIAALATPDRDIDDIFNLAMYKLSKARPQTFKREIYSGEDERSILDGVVENTNQTDSGTTLPFAYSGFWQFGGLCKDMERGKAIVVAGDFGTTKTTFVEGLLAHVLEQPDGFNALIYSPEWDAGENASRTTQRYGGPTRARIKEHKNYHARKRMSLPAIGRPLDPGEMAAYKSAKARIESRPGKMWHIARNVTVERLRGYVEQIASELAEEGKTLDLLIVDYVQRLQIAEKFNGEAAAMKYLVDALQDIATDYNLVLIMVSQVNKAEGRDARKSQKAGGDEYLDRHSLNFLRGDVPKLIIIGTAEMDHNKVANGVVRWYVTKHNDGTEGGPVRSKYVPAFGKIEFIKEEDFESEDEPLEEF